jgi:hypothetical protein
MVTAVGGTLVTVRWDDGQVTTIAPTVGTMTVTAGGGAAGRRATRESLPRCPRRTLKNHDDGGETVGLNPVAVGEMWVASRPARASKPGR